MNRFRQLLLALFALVAGVLLLAFVEALARQDTGQDRITAVSVLRDPSGALQLSDVLGADFAPASPESRGGYDSAALWFRLTVSPAADAGGTILQLSSNQLDHLTLYTPSPSGWTASESGDTIPFARRAAKVLPLGFLLPETAEGQTLYLRVQSASALTFTIGAHSQASADRHLDRQIALHVIYFSLLGMGILLSALRLRLMPSALSLAILCFMVIYFVYSTEVLGYAPVLIDFAAPGAHNFISETSALLTVLSSMLFHRLYLGKHRPNRIALRLTDTVIGLQSLLVLLRFAGYGGIVGQPSMILSLLALLLVTAMLCTLDMESRIARRALHITYAIWFCFTGLWICSRLGLFDLPIVSRPHVEVYGLNSLFIVLTLMAIDRAEHLRRHHATQLSLVTARATQEANARNATVQDGFMHMLVHEVRNNLSVLQMGLPEISDTADRDPLARAIRDLDRSLVEARHATWLSRGTWPVDPRPLSVIEALDKALDPLACADRIELHGDDAEASVVADAGMLGAALSAAFGALCDLARTDCTLRLFLSQSEPDSACTIRVETQLAAPLPDGHSPLTLPQFALCAMILRQMGGSLSLTRHTPQSLGIAIGLPARPEQVDMQGAA